MDDTSFSSVTKNWKRGLHRVQKRWVEKSFLSPLNETMYDLIDEVKTA